MMSAHVRGRSPWRAVRTEEERERDATLRDTLEIGSATRHAEVETEDVQA
jgi:hypothetical protein